MASIIRIKRSGVSGNPAVLGAGELAYSALTDNGSNGGDRLYIGFGTETGGNAANHYVIGGKYFTDMMDHTKGTLTASSALIVDSDSKVDNFKVDNLDLNGNTISTTDLNGSLTLAPNGTGDVNVDSDTLRIGDSNSNATITTNGTGDLILNTNGGTDSGNITIADGVDANISITPNGTGKISLDGQLWPNAVGVDGYYLKTASSGTLEWAAIPSGTFTIAAESGANQSFTTGNTFTIAAGEGIDTSVNKTVDDVTITITGEDATTSNKGIASFNSTYFSVASGAVSINDEYVQDTVGAMVSSNNETNISVTYDDANAKLDFSVATATDSVLGVASFNSTYFSVASGAVSINDEYVQDTIGSMVSGNSETNISVTYDDANAKLDFSVATATTSVLGVASFNSTYFSVATGAVSINDEYVQDTIGSMVFGNNETNISVTYDDANAKLDFSVATATSSVLGVASFSSSDFTVTSGAVAITNVNLGTQTTGNYAADVTVTAGTGLSITGTAGEGTSFVLAGVNASTTVKGVASFSSDNFAVTDGAVTIKDGGIANAELVNSSVTVGTTAISLGASSTTIAGLTQVDVNNIRVTGNTISSTNTDGNISLDPNGTGTVDVNGAKITNLGTPTSDTDAATKAYVDATKSGLDVKQSVRLATTADLTVTYSNGTDGVGATLTNADTQSALTLDGVPAVNGDRILVKNQSTALQNGIYTVTDIGSISSNWVLTRATDFDQDAEVTGGAFTFVETGNTQADNGYVMTANGTIDIGTDGITWVQFSGAGQITAGDGLDKVGNTLSVRVDDSTIEINADILRLKDAGTTFAKIQNVDGLSVVGRAGNTSGVADEITAASDHQVLRRSGTSIGFGAVDLGQSNAITGTLVVGNGGTGFTSATTNGIIYGNSTSALQVTAAGIWDATNGVGQLLSVNASGVPTWTNNIDGGTY